ncbi:type VII secretion protein EccE [Aldersonia sp. NBC_00410]|uniref:type VII secretion protein EccE n=1 Tax=Aldersonia sp. NBC_00410 TaxID=2975954 RepID=UPI00225A2676|nr:type VII secretion protein EccE [Aldersonia sp. NBC_00410]MCX5046299.1 type VII secretion protein EccE [Aldersonia sp. NBC_00410]
MSTDVGAALPRHAGTLTALAVGTSLLVTAATATRAWWAPLLVLVAMLGAGVLTIDGAPLIRRALHPVALLARRRALAAPAAVVDVEVAGAVTGVRWGEDGLVSMISVGSRDPLSPTVFAGDAGPVDCGAIDLPTVARWLRFGDVVVGVDATSAGLGRMPGAGKLGDYTEVVGHSPLVASRATWLLVRLDPGQNLDAIKRRGSAPKTLAAATVRIAERLRQDGICAQPLRAAQLRSQERMLAPPAAAEQWDHVRAGQLIMTSYAADPTELAGAHRWWSAEAHTATVVRLRSGPGEDVDVSGLVRYTTRDQFMQAPLPGLVALPGEQGAALAAGLPTARSRALTPAGRDLTEAGLDVVPIGPTGQLIGRTADGNGALTLPLFRPIGGARKVIDVSSGEQLADQLVLRAITAGARVELHTEHPARWRRLLAHGDGRMWLAGQHKGGAAAHIVVLDRVEQSEMVDDRTPTLLALRRPGDPVPDLQPDARIAQPDPRRPQFVLTIGPRRFELVVATTTAEAAFRAAGSAEGTARPVRHQPQVNTGAGRGTVAAAGPPRDARPAAVGQRDAAGRAHHPPVWRDPAPGGWSPPPKMPDPASTSANGAGHAARPQPSSSFEIEQARQRSAELVRQEQDQDTLDREKEPRESGPAGDPPPTVTRDTRHDG